jgi:hypothetical protein
MEEFILNNYYTLGSGKIATLLGCGRDKVLKIAKKLNLDTSISTVKKNLKNRVQIESFEKYKKILEFNTSKNSYLLGFLWADGHLNKDCLTCSIAKKDSYHMRNIFLSYNFKESPYIQTIDNKEYNMVRYSIYNKDIMFELSKLGFIQKSFSSPTAIYSILDSNNFKYFIAGFFDGDGNMSKSKTNRVISFAFDSRCDTSFFERYLENFVSKVFVRKFNGNSKSLCISRKKYHIYYAPKK